MSCRPDLTALGTGCGPENKHTSAAFPLLDHPDGGKTERTDHHRWFRTSGVWEDLWEPGEWELDPEGLIQVEILISVPSVWQEPSLTKFRHTPANFLSISSSAQGSPSLLGAQCTSLSWGPSPDGPSMSLPCLRTLLSSSPWENTYFYSIFPGSLSTRW